MEDFSSHGIEDIPDLMSKVNGSHACQKISSRWSSWDTRHVHQSRSANLCNKGCVRFACTMNCHEVSTFGKRMSQKSSDAQMLNSGAGVLACRQLRSVTMRSRPYNSITTRLGCQTLSIHSVTDCLLVHGAIEWRLASSFPHMFVIHIGESALLTGRRMS